MVTRRREPLRPTPLASWELRVGQYRVYYQVTLDDDEAVVTVVAVCVKMPNRVFIGGVEVNIMKALSVETKDISLEALIEMAANDNHQSG